MSFPASALQNPWGELRILGLHFLAGSACCLLQGCDPRVDSADLVIVNGNEPESLDPAIVTGVSEMRITKALFEGLMRIEGRNGRPVPGLAESFQMSPDARVYTFTLRTNAAWSTGESITAHDVAYSWVRALSPTTAGDYAGQLFYIKNAELFYTGKISDPAQLGVRALDNRHLQVELEYPVPFFLDLCSYPTLAVVPRKTIQRFGDRWLSTRPLPCSGPYQLVSWRLNDRVRLRRSPNYYAAAQTRSEVVDLPPVGNPNTALNLYETGVADIVWDKDLVPTELMDVLKGRPDVHTYTLLGTCFYRFNVKRKPFDNVLVRKAFALATDRALIVRKLTLAGEKPAFSFVPTGVANYQPPEGISYDPIKARQLLAEAGFPDGRDFPRFEYSFYSAASGGARTPAKVAVELQQMWLQALGVRAELRQTERKIFFSQQSRLDFDISASSWIGDYNDPNTFLDLFISNGGNNRTGWSNPEYDKLIRLANLQSNTELRSQLFQRAETMLVDQEMPMVPLYFYAGFTLYHPDRIEGIFPNVLDEHPLQDIGRRNLASRVHGALSHAEFNVGRASVTGTD